MSELFYAVISSVTASAIITSILAWVFRSWISERLKNAIKSEYDIRLETHKAALKNQYDIEAERLRSQLNIIAIEHEVKFSRLHDKRAEIIADLYSLLVKAHWDAGSFSSPIEMGGEPSKLEKYNLSQKSLFECRLFFEKNRIYLPEKLCELLGDLIGKMSSHVHHFGMMVQMNSDHSGEMLKAWIAAWGHIDKDFPAAKKSLEKELRKILGDTE